MFHHSKINDANYIKQQLLFFFFLKNEVLFWFFSCCKVHSLQKMCNLSLIYICQFDTCMCIFVCWFFFLPKLGFIINVWSMIIFLKTKRLCANQFFQWTSYLKYWTDIKLFIVMCVSIYMFYFIWSFDGKRSVFWKLE